MLSPHEFAALLLVGNERDLDELDRADLASLVERQLIALERLSTGRHLHLTDRGDLIVKAVNRRQR